MSSGPFGSALGTKDYVDSGIPVIRGQNVQPANFVSDKFVYISNDKAEELSRSTAYPDDIIIVAVGAGAGNSALIPHTLPKSVLSQNCNKFTLDQAFVKPEYILLNLQVQIARDQMQSKTTDTARQFLSLTNLKEMLFPVPPFEEQEEIVRRVKQLFKVAAQIEERYQKAQAFIDKLPQAILAKAFRGQLVPQDPTDEPASALLERIQTERAQREAAAKAAKKAKTKTNSGKKRGRKPKAEATPGSTSQQPTIPGLE